MGKVPRGHSHSALLLSWMLCWDSLVSTWFLENPKLEALQESNWKCWINLEIVLGYYWLQHIKCLILILHYITLLWDCYINGYVLRSPFAMPSPVSFLLSHSTSYLSTTAKEHRQTWAMLSLRVIHLYIDISVYNRYICRQQSQLEYIWIMFSYLNFGALYSNGAWPWIVLNKSWYWIIYWFCLIPCKSLTSEVHLILAYVLVWWIQHEYLVCNSNTVISYLWVFWIRAGLQTVVSGRRKLLGSSRKW